MCGRWCGGFEVPSILAAPSDANFGIEGTLANLCFSCPFRARDLHAEAQHVQPALTLRRFSDLADRNAGMTSDAIDHRAGPALGRLEIFQVLLAREMIIGGSIQNQRRPPINGCVPGAQSIAAALALTRAQ